MCARCTGIYIGFIFSFIFFLMFRRYRNAGLPDKYVFAYMIIGLSIYMFDALSSYSHLRSTTNGIRLFTGLFIGTALPMFMLPLAKGLMYISNETETFAKGSDIPFAILPAFIVGLVMYMGIVNFLVTYYLISLLMIAGYFSLMMLAWTIVFSKIKKITNKNWSPGQLFTMAGIAFPLQMITSYFIHLIAI